MSLWLPPAVLFVVLVAYGASCDLRRWIARKLDDLDRGFLVREARARERESGLSDVILASLPDDELTDSELRRKVEWEARSFGEIAELERVYRLPCAADPRWLV